MLSGNIPAVSARDILPIDADRLDELWTIMQYLRECPPLQTQPETYSTAFEETMAQIKFTANAAIVKL